MEWISVKDKLPDISNEENRYLVATKCLHKTHNLTAFDWPFPCGEVNIAYYDNYYKWHYSSIEQLDTNVEITHWSPLPKMPDDEEKC